MRRLLAILTAAVLLAVSVTACSSAGDSGAAAPQTDTEESAATVLTERQKDILTQEGLPTNYDDLSLLQKSAITAIGDMLDYIENKYSHQFMYLGYVAAGPLEKEHLDVYPVGKSSRDVVTVYRDYVGGEYVYSDNYPLLEANTLYQEAMESFFNSYAGVEYKAYVNVTSSEEDAAANSIISVSSASNYVFVNSQTCNEIFFSSIVDDFSSWIVKESKGQATSSTTLLLVNSDLAKITKYNYTDKTYAISAISEKVVIVGLNGNATIR